MNTKSRLGRLAGALGAGRFFESFLYGVKSKDPIVLAIAVVMLIAVFAFVGIVDPEVITADGVNISARQREVSLKAAQAEIGTLAIA